VAPGCTYWALHVFSNFKIRLDSLVFLFLVLVLVHFCIVFTFYPSNCSENLHVQRWNFTEKEEVCSDVDTGLPQAIVHTVFDTHVRHVLQQFTLPCANTRSYLQFSGVPWCSLGTRLSEYSKVLPGR
jgi:hypothetical protein